MLFSRNFFFENCNNHQTSLTNFKTSKNFTRDWIHESFLRMSSPLYDKFSKFAIQFFVLAFYSSLDIRKGSLFSHPLLDVKSSPKQKKKKRKKRNRDNESRNLTL